MPTRLDSPYRKQISLWLAGVCLLVAMTVVVGGITRLTNSGLSITEWKPLIGALPPLHEQDWEVLFEKYKQIPEYSTEHPDMDLDGFKVIFYWEWAHRNLGRFIGLFFLLPYLIFTLQGKITKPLHRRLLVGFALGGLQGLMGWLMVKSGLTDRVDVSHYRLAIHLFLAFTIFSYFLRLILDLNVPTHLLKPQSALQRFRAGLVILHSFIGLQIIYGAFVAGLRAGHFFNTFPTMNGFWIPYNAFVYDPLFLSPFENPAMVQFIHRWLGAGVLIGCAVLYFVARKLPLNSVQKNICAALTLTVFIQFLLGVFTLIWHMPLTVASAHQLGGLVVFGFLTAATYFIRRTA